MRIKECPLNPRHGDDLLIWEQLLSKLQTELIRYRNGERISLNDISNAICILLSDHPEFEHPLDMYSIEPNFDILFNDLKDYRFEFNRFSFESSKEGIDISLSEIKGQIKHKGIVWVLHKYDADPFPSSPHAHNLLNGLKLHLGTGAIYQKKKAVGQLRKKEILEIRDLFIEKGFAMPSIEI
ncbi:hypothetical protein [Chitinophaga polysaccharea]|uniref:hypothetical protein n=1 Tax=Chitinophaga polysaccharea TaxID=1293035 RepID=UPI00115B1422|nr:hypothetical protein [Chitinophaga polysaccharea]